MYKRWKGRVRNTFSYAVVKDPRGYGWRLRMGRMSVMNELGE